MCARAWAQGMTKCGGYYFYMKFGFQRPLKDLSAPAENSRTLLSLPAKHVSMPDLTRFIASLNTLRFLSPLPSIPNLLMVIRYRTTMRCHRHHTKVASYYNGWEEDTQKESVPLGTQYRSQEHVAYLRHASYRRLRLPAVETAGYLCLAPLGRLWQYL